MFLVSTRTYVWSHFANLRTKISFFFKKKKSEVQIIVLKTKTLTFCSVQEHMFVPISEFLKSLTFWKFTYEIVFKKSLRTKNSFKNLKVLVNIKRGVKIYSRTPH